MADDVQQPMPANLGRYKIVRELGRGAMGVVYEGYDPLIQRRVAVKTALRSLLATSGNADELLTRFIREARAAGALNHPNIITIYDTGEEEGIAYIAMEFVEGGTLQDRLKTGDRWDPAEVVALGAVLAETLGAAHEAGVIHRDVKPANIMLPVRGPAKLTDFGIAHVHDSTFTQQGDMIGTPYYMSPEQFMGQKIDARADLFSLGIILYEMLTGEKPFRGQAVNTIMHEVLKSAPTPPDQLNYSVTACLSAVLLKALAKSPLNRYQNGIAFAAALRESLKENPDPAITKIVADDATLVGACETTTLGPPVDTGEVPAAGGRAAAGFRWRRSHTAAAGIVAVMFIAVLMLLALRAPDGALGHTTGPGAANYYGTVHLRVYGISDQGCYAQYEAAEDKGSINCYDFDIAPTGTISDAYNVSDHIALGPFQGTVKVDLGEQGKRWAKYRVSLEHPEFEAKELVEQKEASAPAQTTSMDFYLIGKYIDQSL
jgi:hypothetical protein